MRGTRAVEVGIVDRVWENQKWSGMQRVVCILAVALGCLISSDVWAADKPMPLTLEERTTLRVGELAVLQIPPDRRYSYFDGNTGAGNVLVLVRRSRRRVLYRAVRPGLGTVVISPDIPNGQCVSCATLHYFIDVVSPK